MPNANARTERLKFNIAENSISILFTIHRWWLTWVLKIFHWWKSLKKNYSTEYIISHCKYKILWLRPLHLSICLLNKATCFLGYWTDISGRHCRFLCDSQCLPRITRRDPLVQVRKLFHISMKTYYEHIPGLFFFFN